MNMISWVAQASVESVSARSHGRAHINLQSGKYLRFTTTFLGVNTPIEEAFLQLFHSTEVISWILEVLIAVKPARVDESMKIGSF